MFYFNNRNHKVEEPHKGYFGTAILSLVGRLSTFQKFKMRHVHYSCLLRPCPHFVGDTITISIQYILYMFHCIETS